MQKRKGYQLSSESKKVAKRREYKFAYLGVELAR